MDEQVRVRFTADTRGFDRGAQKVGRGLASLAKGALGLAGVGLGLKGLVNMEKAFVGLESSARRVTQLFGDSSKYIQYFAETTTASFGMSESIAYQYAATFGNLFRGITTGAEENSKVTVAMLKAAAVVASKTGRSMQDVTERIRSGLLGSTEAIEDLGINVNVSMLEMTDAFKKIADGRSWQQLNFYEQQQVRTLGILEQAHNNFGDSVDKGSAFTLASLGSAFKDLTAYGGQFINAALQPISQWLTTIVREATTALKALASLIGLEVDTGGNYAGSLEKAVEAQEDLTAETKKTAKARSMLAGFDELNILGSEKGASGGTDPTSGGLSSVFDSLELPELGDSSNKMAAQIERLSTRARGALDRLRGSIDGVKPSVRSMGQSFSQLWKNTLAPMASFFIFDFAIPLAQSWGNTVLPILGEATVWALQEMATHFEWVVGVYNTLWETILKPIWIGIREAIKDVWEIASDLWDKHGRPLMDNLSLFFETFRGLCEALWTEVLQPIIEPFLEMVSWLWDKHLSHVVYRVGDFLGTLINGTVEFYNGFIAPIVDWLIHTLGPVFSVVFSYIGDVFGTVFGIISDVVGGILRVLGGIIDFIVGVFTGDWEQAWEGVKDIFLGIWDAVSGVLKGAVNLIIDALNAFIRGLNKIKFDVPSWVPLIGGKKFGFEIPLIPKLADGGFITGPSLVAVGETRQKEVVIPLERDTGWATILAQKITAASGGSQGGGPIIIPVYVGGRKLYEAVIDESKRQNARAGRIVAPMGGV